MKSTPAARNLLNGTGSPALPWVLLLAMLAASGQAEARRCGFEEGIARNPQSTAEMFREQHFVRSSGDRAIERLVIYRCPDGTAFGRKRIDYRDSALAPAFALEDLRSGYREGLRRDAAPALFFRPDGRTAERSAPLASTGLVADAGFDEFVRLHWSRLVAGETLPLEFAVPSRLRSLPFSVSRPVKPCCSARKPGCSRSSSTACSAAGSGDRSQLRTAQPSPPALRGSEQPARRQGRSPTGGPDRLRRSGGQRQRGAVAGRAATPRCPPAAPDAEADARAGAGHRRGLTSSH